MSGKLISFLKAMTICLPFLIGVFRFKAIDSAYKPFIFYLMAGVITEVLTYLLIDISATSNAVLSNIFCLAEWLIIVWQFYSWGFFKKDRTVLGIVVCFVTVLWITENILFGKLTVFSPYYRETYFFFLVLMSVNIINYTIINDYKNILRNARFLICLGFIFFFIYKMIYEWAYQIINIKSYEALSNQIIGWFGYVNASVNILFAIAVLLIPSYQQFKSNKQ